MALQRFFSESRRVLMVTKKPDKEEYATIVKVTGIGMLAIGMIGFLILLATILLGLRPA